MNLQGERKHEEANKRQTERGREKRGEKIKWGAEGRWGLNDEKGRARKGIRRTDGKQETEWRWQTVTELWCGNGKVRARQMEMERRYSWGRTRMTSFGKEPIRTHKCTCSEAETMRDKSKIATGVNIYAWQHNWAQVNGTHPFEITLVLSIRLSSEWSLKNKTNRNLWL